MTKLTFIQYMKKFRIGQLTFLLCLVLFAVIGGLVTQYDAWVWTGMILLCLWSLLFVVHWKRYNNGKR